MVRGARFGWEWDLGSRFQVVGRKKSLVRYLKVSYLVRSKRVMFEVGVWRLAFWGRDLHQ